MGFDILQEKAKLAGFSKILGAPANQFIFLSDNTNGRCGRRVYINSSLSQVFLDNVKAEDFAVIMHRLEQLRATAGGLQTFSSIENAFEHFSTVERFQVGYKIFQTTLDKNKKPGVYITSLEAYDIKGERPGLYNVRHVDGKWKSKKSEKISNTYAAVNGLTEDLDMAATKIIPQMLESAYSSKEYQGHVKDGYSLVYNPPELYYKGLKWKTPQNKMKGKDFTAKLLGDAMLDAQRRGKEVNWVIHGDGAKVFLEAMQRISSHKLDKHRAIFLAPKDDMVKILPLMKKSEMKLHESVMLYQDDDWSDGHNFNRTRTGVADEVAKFEGFDQKAAAMRSSATSNKLKAAGLVAASATAATSLPATLGMGSLLAGAGMVWGAQSLRNMASTNIADPALNPHLNPFKSPDEMHAHVISETGGIGKSFAAVVKAKLKGRA